MEFFCHKFPIRQKFLTLKLINSFVEKTNYIHIYIFIKFSTPKHIFDAFSF